MKNKNIKIILGIFILLFFAVIICIWKTDRVYNIVKGMKDNISYGIVHRRMSKKYDISDCVPLSDEELFPMQVGE